MAEAQKTAGERRAALHALMGQRAAGADTPGDTESADTLAARTERVQADLETVQAHLKTMEDELSAAQAEIVRLTAAVTKLQEQAKSETQRAVQADKRADAFDADVARAAAALGAEWADVLATDAAYDEERAAVDARREMAARASELDAVAREQGDIERTAASLAKQAGHPNPAHEQPPADAETAHTRAQDMERASNVQLGEAKTSLKQLEENRCAHARLSDGIDVAFADERTHSTLANLLREGGEIQALLAGQAQRQIVQEVNSVLERLGDVLKVELGGARRATAVPLEDIQVLDRSDTSGQARFFEFLSGGEQFRIALALALALHRRVGREAGTLIVDEGFGALDSRRRHELAARLTDTADTILDQGLARSIVICSHSEEVQRQFPNRWHVRKQGDAATVTLVDTSDPSDDGIAFA